VKLADPTGVEVRCAPGELRVIVALSLGVMLRLLRDKVNSTFSSDEIPWYLKLHVKSRGSVCQAHCEGDNAMLHQCAGMVSTHVAREIIVDNGIGMKIGI
jgi:hypothetical protein